MTVGHGSREVFLLLIEVLVLADLKLLWYTTNQGKCYMIKITKPIRVSTIWSKCYSNIKNEGIKKMYDKTIYIYIKDII